MTYVRAREADGPRSNGVGNITTGVKWRFFADEERGTALAIFPQLSCNSSSAAAKLGHETRGYSFLMPLVAGFKSGDTGYYAEVGHNFVQEGPHEWQVGLKALHQCLPELECRVELKHSRVPHDGGQTTASVYGKYRLQQGLILNVSAGRDIAGNQEGGRSLVMYIGLQFLR
ncbi:hypothetical protein ACHMW6_25065 [Pseudoduganella sp. UC29_106]|uniref:hypothetical protein n=1 Tax=Pseudoduganella sp. UC29_106 TaxID=3374553 RepID=UPI0037572F2A